MLTSASGSNWRTTSAHPAATTASTAARRPQRCWRWWFLCSLFVGCLSTWSSWQVIWTWLSGWRSTNLYTQCSTLWPCAQLLPTLFCTGGWIKTTGMVSSWSSAARINQNLSTLMAHSGHVPQGGWLWMAVMVDTPRRLSECWPKYDWIHWRHL